jgi:C1A family cysteine protease
MKQFLLISTFILATCATAQPYLGADGPTYQTERSVKKYQTGLVLPKEWDSRKVKASLPKTVKNLPKKFSWQDKLTPIKNQGNCGSCWAFAAQATLSDVMKLHGKGTVDLSEQWMVSCDDESSGCNGGWYHTAFDLVRVEGNVLEKDMPYKQTTGRCPASVPHIDKINLYKELSSGVASSDLIKQAIYLYGPVSVAVSVTGDFDSYSSGIYNAGTSGAVNHAVNLVGWDETVKPYHWIMRNSWGKEWGEDGYMRIAYGSKKIGYAATYVDAYGPVPHEDVKPEPTPSPEPTPQPEPTPSPEPTPGPTPIPDPCQPCTFFRWIATLFNM